MLSFGSATLLGSLFAEKKVHAYVMSAVPSRVPNVKDFMMRLGLSDVHYDLVGAPTNITNPVIERHIRDGELSPFYSYSKYHSGIKRYVVQRTKIKILRNFLRSKYDTMIMFEDDVALNTEYFDEEGAVTATAAMLNTADKWDLQYLGFCFECKHVGGGGKHNFLEIPGFQSSKEDFYYQTAFMPLCNHAVIFSKKAAKAFIELSRPFHFLGDLILTHIICLTGMQKANLAIYSYFLHVINCCRKICV